MTFPYPVLGARRARGRFRSVLGLLLVCSAVSALAQTAPSSSQQPAAPTTKPQDIPEKPSDANGAPDSEAAPEMRGLWVVRDSLTSPDAVHQVVVTAVKYHFNTLFVQVRGRADAYYNSPYEPRSDLLARQSADFDPLQRIVEEAHANGLEVHAWLNTYLAWSGARNPSSSKHLWNAHRDWFSCDREGHCSPVPNASREGAFLQPSNPAVQQHLFNVFTDVATRYDVDGIHFDYCRYCGPAYDFSGSTLVRFRASLRDTLPAEVVARIDSRQKQDRLAWVHAFGAEWETWRRAQVTDLVARISTAVKTAKPWLQVSAAVFADAKDAFRARGQDWQGWLRAGYLDAVALMAYAKSTERILEQTRQAVAAAGEKHVYTGIGAWRLSAHDVARKITEVRQTGAAGVNLFSYDGVHTRSHYLDTLARGVFASRAATPRMRWLPSRGGSAGRTRETAPSPDPVEDFDKTERPMPDPKPKGH